MKFLLLALLGGMSLYAQAPTTVSVSPSNGGGSRVVFTARYSIGAGSDYTYIIINSTAVPTSSCWVFAYVPTQEFFLRDDGNTSDLGPVVGGAGTTVANSQCTVNALGSSVTISGSTATMLLDVSFKPTYAGAKNVYLYSSGPGGGSSVDDRGDWTAAVTYYVDQTGGNDSYDGLASAFVSGSNGPWKTLSKVNSSTFAAGDQVLLKRGERWREPLVFPSSGNSAASIILGDYGTGSKPIIDGSEVVTGWTLNTGSVYYKASWNFNSQEVFQNDQYLTRGSNATLSAGQYWYDSGTGRLYVRMTDSSDPATKTVEAAKYPNQFVGLIRINGKSYITVQNLDLRKSNHYSFLIQAGSDHITVRWCDINRSYQNVFEVKGELGTARSTNVDLLYNTLTTNGIARGYMLTGESEAVGVSFVGVQGGNIIGNTVTDEGGEGIQFNAGASNLTVKSNRVINSYVVGFYLGAGYGNGGHTTNIEFSDNYFERGSFSNSQGMSISTEAAPSPFTFDAGTDVITATYDLTWLDQYEVVFQTGGGTLPTGITAGTTYYTRDLSGTTFKISATRGGSAIDLSGSISGTPLVYIAHRIDGVNFHHNIVRGNGDTAGCFAFGNGQFPGGNIRNVKFHHNVCTNSNYGVIAVGPTDDTSNVFSNNILSVTAFGRAYWIAENSGVSNSLSNYPTVDYDVVYGPNLASFIVELGGATIPFTSGTLYTLSGWQGASVHADHSVAADPLLTNPGSEDYTIPSNSPAVNAGIVVSGMEQSKYGSAPDIGYYEYAPGKLATATTGTGQPLHWTKQTSRLRNRFRARVN